MANKKIDMLQLKQLLRLYTQDVSKVQISKQLGLSRNTVKKYICLFHEHQFTYGELSELGTEEIEDLFDTTFLEPDGKEKSLERYFPYVSKELRKVGVTRYLLWEEYKTKHREGYSPHICTVTQTAVLQFGRAEPCYTGTVGTA